MHPLVVAYSSAASRASAWLAARGPRFWAFLLAAVGALIYLPYLGSYPLWDPWEPHYTQVAWEMQERGTWLDPYYQGQNNWWSKPILLLWMLRASLTPLWDSVADFHTHELAARLPFALAAIGGGLLQFDWVRRLFGLAAGVIAGLIVMTAPQYLVIGRQVMIDVTFVVTYAASLGYLGVGLFTTPAPAEAPPARLAARAAAALGREWPFLAFWLLQAIAALAKGFVAATLAALVLAGYAVATFRWQDYRTPESTTLGWRYFSLRGGAVLCALGLVVAARPLLGRELVMGSFVLVSLYYVARAALTYGREVNCDCSARVRWTYALAPLALGALAVASAALLGQTPSAAPARERNLLYLALVFGSTSAALVTTLFHQVPIIRHALRLLVRIRFAYGLALLLVVAGPWYVYMSVQHGWPYWNEFIFYHHLGRAAGTIDKPGNTFDYFVRQLAYGLFPWSAFAVPALWSFARRASYLRSIAERRNLYILLAALLPYLFFSLQGTKFAHYVFPVLPMLAAMIAVALVWLGRRDTTWRELREPAPALGPSVHQGSAPASAYWEDPASRGDLLVVAAIALVTFGLLSFDLVSDFRYLLRLFLYYWNRPTPPDYQPYVELQYFFFPLGITLGVLLLARYVSKAHVALFGAIAVGLSCYVSWVMMPAMKWTYSFKPFLSDYERLAQPGEPIGQYIDWEQPVRSVMFLFQNRCAHLKTDKRAEAFLARPGRKFVLVDSNKLASLRRIAARLDQKLYVVAKDHPYAVMVSNVPNAEDVLAARQAVLSELPADATPFDADFDGKIRLVGVRAPKEPVVRGREVDITFFYRATTLMDQDWQVFVHGDGPRGSSHRIHADHFPVRGLYPTTEWQEGELIADTFTVRIPRGYPFDEVTLWTGLYHDDKRLELRNNAPNDGDNRVRGPRLTVRDD